METTKGNNRKINLPGLDKVLGAMQSKNWILTILFFFVAFAVAVYVWWDCIQQDTPRPLVVTTFNNGKEDFEQMSRKVSGAIDQLRLRKEEFDHSKDYAGQRELFRMWQEDKQEDEPAEEREESAADTETSSQADKKETTDTAGATNQQTELPISVEKSEAKLPAEASGSIVQ